MVNQFYDIYPPSRKIITTQKTMTMLESNFNKILLNINPGVIHFPTATTINEGKKKKTLRPYMAPVNHNILNTEKAINIALTLFWEIFVVETKAKILRWKPWVWILV